MQTSVDISYYPLNEEFIPHIKDFIERVNQNKLTGYSISNDPVKSPINLKLNYTSQITDQNKANISPISHYIYDTILLTLFLIITFLLIRFIYKIQI